MDPITLPSGRELKITLSPFDVSKELFQVILEEGKELKLDPEAEVDANFWKDVFCVCMSSKKIEKCVWKCMEKCLIDKIRIDKEAFESEEHRDDYLTVVFEVAKANVMPFTKSLSAKYAFILDLLKKDQSQK